MPENELTDFEICRIAPAAEFIFPVSMLLSVLMFLARVENDLESTLRMALIEFDNRFTPVDNRLIPLESMLCKDEDSFPNLVISASI